MAFPVVEGSTSSNQAGETTSHSVSLPSSIAANELLLFIFANTNFADPSTPTGWTELSPPGQAFAGPNGDVRFRVYYKTASGGEGSSVSVSTNQVCSSSHIAYRISGWSDIEAAGESKGGSTSTSVDPPSLTPSGGALDYLWIAMGCAGELANLDFTSAPTNFSNLVSQRAFTGSGGNVTAGAATRSVNASSQDPDAFTLDQSTSWVATTIAIKPESETPVSQAITVQSHHLETVQKQTALETHHLVSGGPTLGLSAHHMADVDQTLNPAALAGSGVAGTVSFTATPPAQYLAPKSFYDAFTDTNGVLSENHSPDIGTGWTLVTGTDWEVQDNWLVNPASSVDTGIVTSDTPSSKFYTVELDFALKYDITFEDIQIVGNKQSDDSHLAVAITDGFLRLHSHSSFLEGGSFSPTFGEVVMTWNVGQVYHIKWVMYPDSASEGAIKSKIFVDGVEKIDHNQGSPNTAGWTPGPSGIGIENGNQAGQGAILQVNNFFVHQTAISASAAFGAVSIDITDNPLNPAPLAGSGTVPAVDLIATSPETTPSGGGTKPWLPVVVRRRRR